MSAEALPGKIIGKWEFTGVMGGDMPGMTEGEPPFLAQEIWDRIEEEHRHGLIPAGKKRGIAVFGPITKMDGTKVTIVLKVEYDEADIKDLKLDSSEG